MSIYKRDYKDYNKYLKHQSKKLDIGMGKKIKKFMPERVKDEASSFKKRINGFIRYIKGNDVLCLGARLGGEVLAFRELGFKNSIGIDINPGPDNEYVIKGDFHDMPFKNNSFDIVYSNSIDHAWSLRKLSKEINRVLRKDGILVLEIDHLLKKKEKERKELLKKPSKYESIMWDNFKDIKNAFKEFEFERKFIGKYDIFLVVIFKK